MVRDPSLIPGVDMLKDRRLGLRIGVPRNVRIGEFDGTSWDYLAFAFGGGLGSLCERWSGHNQTGDQELEQATGSSTPERTLYRLNQLCKVSRHNACSCEEIAVSADGRPSQTSCSSPVALPEAFSPGRP